MPGVQGHGRLSRMPSTASLQPALTPQACPRPSQESRTKPAVKAVLLGGPRSRRGRRGNRETGLTSRGFSRQRWPPGRVCQQTLSTCCWDRGALRAPRWTGTPPCGRSPILPSGLSGPAWEWGSRNLPHRRGVTLGWPWGLAPHSQDGALLLGCSGPVPGLPAEARLPLNAFPRWGCRGTREGRRLWGHLEAGSEGPALRPRTSLAALSGAGGGAGTARSRTCRITATKGGYSHRTPGSWGTKEGNQLRATSCERAALPPAEPAGGGCSSDVTCLFSPSQDHHRGAPASETRDKDGFPRPSRTPGPPPYCPAAKGAQSSSRKVGSHYWQAKGSLVPHTLPDPGSPRLATNVRPSPLGIPYSKLSQSKHLKARPGGGQWASSDPRQRVQTPRDHKDP